MRFSPKDVKMTWLGIGKTAPLEFRTEKIFEKNIGGGSGSPPLGSTGLRTFYVLVVYVILKLPELKC